MSFGEVLTPKGRFDPLPDGHSLIGADCPVCERPMRAGDIPALIEIGPADAEEQAKADAGRPYNAAGRAAHESCVFTD